MTEHGARMLDTHGCGHRSCDLGDSIHEYRIVVDGKLFEEKRKNNPIRIFMRNEGTKFISILRESANGMQTLNLTFLFRFFLRL